MRYRRLSYRYEMVMRPARIWPLGHLWPTDRMRLLVQGSWQPDADVYETARGVAHVLVIEGLRRLPSCQEGAVYHAAAIRQGSFQLALPLPAAVDADGVEARY